MFKIKPEKFFVFCALTFGILLITIIPPFQSPDEDSHFKKSYVISKGEFFPTSKDGIVGYNLPVDMTNYISDKLNYIGNRDKKYTYSEEVLDERIPKDYLDTTFQNFSTAEITPIAYIAPAIGILFSNIVTSLLGMENISVVIMLHFARFFSLILYIFLCYVAIKKTPILKKTFCAIALLPMSLSLAVAISYDSIIISFSLLATALILKLIYDENVKKVTYKYLIAFGIIAFILLTIKTVYVTVLIPLIFVPKEKFGGKKFSILKKFGIILLIVGSLYLINKIPLICLEKNAVESNSGEQISFIISNPIKYLKIWIKTMISNRVFYFTGIIGIFGLIDTYIPTVYTVMYSLGLFGIILSDFSLCLVKFNWKYKLISVLGSVLTIFAVFLGLYIYWTSMELGVGAETISGIQGRYFIPIIPLVMVIFSNSKLRKNKTIEKIMNQILEYSYFVPIMMLFVMLGTIFLRYWS